MEKVRKEAEREQGRGSREIRKGRAEWKEGTHMNLEGRKDLKKNY